MPTMTEPGTQTTQQNQPDQKDSIWTRSFDTSLLDVWLGGAGLLGAAVTAVFLGERGLDIAGKLALASAALLAFGLFRRFTAK
jgi:hypothetical protein